MRFYWEFRLMLWDSLEEVLYPFDAISLFISCILTHTRGFYQLSLSSGIVVDIS